MSEKTALVTGATGLLGGNICRELAGRGWRVKGLVRSLEKARRFLDVDGIEFVEGDMERVESFASTLDGVDAVFHTAAFFREYYQPGDHWERMKRINVDATMQLLREADARGVARTVFTSSSGVIQTVPGEAVDESSPYSSFAEKNLYFKTKVMAEREIYDFLASSRMDVVMILPGWMMGPGDAAPTSAGQLILDLIAGRLPGLIDGGASLADARDVASATATAAERGKRGERYIVTGPPATMEDIAKGVAEITGAAVPGMRLPGWLAMAVAHLSDAWAGMTGGTSRMPVDGIKTLMEKAVLSSKKAERELDATFRPLSETLSDTVAWYRDRGYIA